MKIRVPIVDFHSHIIPCVDHGSASAEQSEKMLLQAKKAGVATVVATPHFYPSVESVASFLQRRNKYLSLFENYLAEKDSKGISIIAGAEVAVEKELLSVENLKDLCIGDTNYILIEMPKSDVFYSWMYDFLYHVEAEAGLKVILAHVDRYSTKNMRKLLDMGFVAQVNASSLVHGKHRRELLRHCEEGAIELIGSDAHNDKDRGYAPLIACGKKIDTQVLSGFYRASIDVLSGK